MNKEEILREGCKILDTILPKKGFTFKEGPSGYSSGGDFASGEYISGNRKIEIHFRYSLGLVIYHFGDMALKHEEFMKALLGKNGGNKYPGFSEYPMDGFRNLKYDLENYCSSFLEANEAKFRETFLRAQENKKKTGLKGLE